MVRELFEMARAENDDDTLLSVEADGVAMEARPVRVFTPESTFDRMVAMAIERGKLANLLAEDPDSLTWKAIARVVKAVENASPVKAAMAIRPLRSAFLGALLPLARLGAGSAASVE